MKTKILFTSILIILILFPAQALTHRQESQNSDINSKFSLWRLSPSKSIITFISDRHLKLFIIETLNRNPDLAALEDEARAKAQRIPQVKALPDPMFSFTMFLQTPETRVGPQYGVVSLSQKFPWFGKRPTKEQAAIAITAAAQARVEAKKLSLITSIRRMAYELAFLDAEAYEIKVDRQTLQHYEELARAKYSSGIGIGQDVIKIQAEISRDEDKLLKVNIRKATLLARLNSLRNRPKGTRVPKFALPKIKIKKLPSQIRPLRDAAIEHRPEIAEYNALIAASESQVKLAKLQYKPDVTIGMSYALVGGRNDAQGKLSPPQDNGKNILGLYGAINLPIYKDKLFAGLNEAIQKKYKTEHKKNAIIAAIVGDIADLTDRLSLIKKRIKLFKDILMPQAEESLRSAEDAYSTGTLNALDLLDAERFLLEIQIATDRAQTDLLITRAELEGTIGVPLFLFYKSEKKNDPTF